MSVAVHKLGPAVVVQDHDVVVVPELVLFGKFLGAEQIAVGVDHLDGELLVGGVFVFAQERGHVLSDHPGAWEKDDGLDRLF
jgi:hypothetical protein